MKLSKNTLNLLNDVESRISAEVEEDYLSQWRDFWSGKCESAIFAPKRKITTKPGVELQKININDAVEDYDLMLQSQLAKVSDALSNGTSALGIRANYGTGIIPSLFGAEIFIMPREQNTLPTVRTFGDDVIRRIVDSGMPSLDAAFGKKAFEFGEICLEVFKDYPKISKYVQVYHPDTQGPLDIAELLWGSEMFYNMYDEPELVHSFMQLISDTYTAFLEKWFEMYPNRPDMNVHWDYFMKGNICIRNDSAMNLSPELYSEFAFGYDKKLLAHFGGGMVHFCGRGDHYIDILAGAPDLNAINLSQPHLNNMDKIYTSLFEKGKKILGLGNSASREYARRPDATVGMICKSSAPDESQKEENAFYKN